MLLAGTKDSCRANVRSRPLSAETTAQTEKQTYYRRQEAATYLRCSVRKIDQWKHDGDLPFCKLSGRLIVFRRDDLDALMERHRIDVSG
jgi:excisionase family DNA binding protein